MLLTEPSPSPPMGLSEFPARQEVSFGTEPVLPGGRHNGKDFEAN